MQMSGVNYCIYFDVDQILVSPDIFNAERTNLSVSNCSVYHILLREKMVFLSLSTWITTESNQLIFQPGLEPRTLGWHTSYYSFCATNRL